MGFPIFLHSVIMLDENQKVHMWETILICKIWILVNVCTKILD